MAELEGYHRARRRWRPNARQRRVLDTLVAGRTNPQIAAELGITVDGAKWHVSQLLAETGLSTRDELARWWLQERSRAPVLLPFGLTWTRIAAAGAFSAAITLVLLMAIALPHYRDPKNQPQAEGPVTPTTEPEGVRPGTDAPDCDIDLPADFRIVTSAELRQQGLVEIGRVIDAQDCPLRVSNRVDRAYFWVGGASKVDMTSANLHRVSAFSDFRGSNCFECDLGFYYKGEQFMLPLSAISPLRPPTSASTRLPMQGTFDKVNGIGMSSESPQGLYRGLTARGEVSGNHRVAIASNGVVFLDPAPLANASLVAEASTGTAIDTASLTAIGPLGHPNEPSGGAASVNRIISSCYGSAFCTVFYRSEPYSLRAPAGGTIRCLPPAVPSHPMSGEIVVYELTTPTFVLHVQEEKPRDPGDCHDGPIAKGDVISPANWFTLSAFDATGLPISIVAAEDGTLYVGNVATFDLKCPCGPGT